MSVSEYETMQTSVRRYTQVLRRQWWIVALVTVVAIAAAFAYVRRETPVYSASSTVVVGQGDTLFAPGLSVDFQAFTQTISNLLESNVVAQTAIKQLGLHATPTTLLGNLTVSAQPDSAVISVSYHDTNKARAVRILSTLGAIFTQLVDTKLARQSSGSSSTPTSQPVSAVIFDPAHGDPGQVSPKTSRSLAIAAVLGLVAGILLAFLRDALSTTIKTEREAEEAYAGASIGSLPRGALGVSITQLDKLPRKSRVRITEALSMLSARARYTSSLGQGVIAVVGARPEDGKSTVAAHLAWGLCTVGNEVIAVEADLHRPALHRLLGIDPDLPGIRDLMTRNADVENSLFTVEAGASATPRPSRRLLVTGRRGPDGGEVSEPELMPDTAGGRLRLLPAGTTPENPMHALSLGNSASLVTRLRELADYLVIDTPPLLLAGDAYPLIQLADVVVVVCRRGATKVHEAHSARDILHSLGVRNYLIVVSESETAISDTYGYGYQNF
jgi:receptor protein-tyrosine kinase